MKNTVYNFRSRLVVLQEPDLFFEKTKSSRTSNSHGFLYFFESLHTCSPYQCLQSFSLVSFARLNKTEQSSFSKHLDPKLFLTFLLISTHSEKKKTISRYFRKHWQGEHAKFQRRLIASTWVGAPGIFHFLNKRPGFF